MKKSEIIQQLIKAHGTYSKGKFILNGQEVTIEFWSDQDYHDYFGILIDENGGELSQVENVIYESINVNEKIFHSFWTSSEGDLWTLSNSAEDIVSRFILDDEGSFETDLESLEIWYRVCDRPSLGVAKFEGSHSEAVTLKAAIQREKTAFDYYYHDEEKCWVVPTGICSLGGCDKDLIHCKDGEEAYQKALELTKKGEGVNTSFPCHSCYSEYLQECQ